VGIEVSRFFKLTVDGTDYSFMPQAVYPQMEPHYTFNNMMGGSQYQVVENCSWVIWPIATTGENMWKDQAQRAGITGTYTALCLCVPILTLNCSTLYLFQLLKKDPTRRLGLRGAHEIKQHRFFGHMHWEALLERRVKPPYIPPMVSLSCCPISFMEAPTNLTKCKNSVAQHCDAVTERLVEDLEVRHHTLETSRIFGGENPELPG
jgi:hypothetical protein